MAKYHYIPINDYNCPFGVRDLSRNDNRSVDECYYGNGVHRCKYFIRYVWDGKHFGCIECTCDLPDKREKAVPEWEQLSFVF